MGAPIEFTPSLRETYLQILATQGNILPALDAVGISHSTLCRHRKSSPDFARAELDAQQRHRDAIDAEIRRRGIEGWLEPRFGKEGLVGELRKYSDRLLELYAKRFIPAYRDHTKVELSGSIDVNLEEAVRDLTPTEQEQLESLVRALEARKSVPAPSPN